MNSAATPGPGKRTLTAVVNTPGVNPANFTTALSGPARRLHLAGNQGLPGAAGGLAP